MTAPGIDRQRTATRLGNGLLSVSAAALLILCGCGHKQNATAPATDAQPAAAAVPSGGSSSAASTPSAPSRAAHPAARPEPAAAPAPKTYTIPSGTRISIRMGQTLNAKNSSVGDSFDGTLARAVSVDGVPVLKAGTPVSGSVIAAKGQGRFKGEGDLGITLNSIGNTTVRTSDYVVQVKGKGKRSAEMIGGGGGAGALIGGLAGGGKGALIGGLVGAGAGTAGSAMTGNKNLVIPAESIVSFTLRDAMTVQ